jgi:sugar lactone lactonase YvrE
MRAPLLLVFCLACASGSGQQIVTIAGAPRSHRADVDRVAAVNAPLQQVYGLLLDRATGRLVIHDQTLVERFEPDGTLLALAGHGFSNNALDGETTDGIPASALRISVLRGIAEDSAGAIYLADAGAGIVFRLARDGTVTRYAGGGSQALSFTDGAAARSVNLGSPRGMVFDSHGNLDIAEAYCRCIRRVDPQGFISTVYTLPPSAPSSAFTYFEGLAIDARDSLFATEFAGHQVVKIAADGSAAVIAGTGVPGFSGDGWPAANAQLQGPSGVSVAPDGTLYIADTINHRIRRITPDGIIATIAGTGTRGFSGDGGPALAAQLAMPAQVLLDPAGNLYVADFFTGHIRKISGGIITTIAGNGDITRGSAPAPLGDGGPALTASLNLVPAVAFDATGSLFVAEMSGNRVRKIAPNGIITTVAGTGATGAAGDGGPALQATLNQPWGITVDSLGSVYVATEDSRIRKIDPNGIITTFAGTGTGTGLNRSQGDGGPAAGATLNEAKGIAVDAAGNVYIADTSNARLRRVDRNGIIQTVAGPGEQGVDYWNAVVISPHGDVLVGTTHAASAGAYSQVQRLNPDGSITPIAGNGTCPNTPTAEFPFDGAQASQIPLCIVIALAFDSHGTLYISEPHYGAVLAMAPDGTIRRIAGSALASSSGDGGPALGASLFGSSYFSPGAVAIDAAGNLFIPQSGANRIREVPLAAVSLKLSADSINWTGPQSQTIGVSPSLGGPLAYLVRIPADAGWLTANRASGRTGEPITLTADPTALTPGIYKTTLTVIVPAVSLQAALPITLNVQ